MAVSVHPRLVPAFLLAAIALPAAPAAQLSEIGSRQGFVRFAAVGDADPASPAGRKVCARVRSWSPEFVIALGERGFPEDGAQVLSWARGEGRQEYVRGPVHLFSLGNEVLEPTASRDGAAAQWLRKSLAASHAPWKIVYLQEAPYSSGPDGSARAPRWPFKEWGADAVMSGRDGHYERLEVDGMTFFVNGPGGSPEPLSAQAPGSRCVFNEEQGAMLIEAAPERIDFRFVTAEGLVVDAHTLRKHGLAGRAPRVDAPALPVRARRP